MNHFTYEEIAAKLEPLGFEPLAKEQMQQLESEWEQSPEEYKEFVDKTAILLTELGSGRLEAETWAWTPSSAKVYAFDMEVFNLETMYENFLRGVAAIGEGELDFTDIEENLEQVDWENGIGTRSVKFKWKGNECLLTANVMSDWFDLETADVLNKIIIDRGFGKRLYFGSDGYQMVFVFYCDAEWAAAFEKMTGMHLKETLG